MTMTIQSIKRKKGIFQDKPYDNIEVSGFVLNSTNEQVLCGNEIETCKFKTQAFTECLDRNIKAIGDPDIKDVTDLVGLCFVPVYNKFGNCDDFTLSVPEKKK